MHYLDTYQEKIPKNQRTSAGIAFMASLDAISLTSPMTAKTILQELKQQKHFLKMIASENYSSLAVQLAMGNLLTDKYSEGSVGKRFYAGCENVDAVENHAARAAERLYGAEHAYVQPHSGADANLIAFLAILTVRVQDKELERLSKRLDKLTKEEYESLRKVLAKQKMMGMALDSGGHLTHGYRHNISSKLLSSSFYEVDPITGLLDYQAIAKKVLQEKPLILVAGYSSYPRKIDFAKMREIADSVGAVLLVDMAHFSGLVAGKVFKGNYNPVPFADIITSTTHKTLRGPRGGMILCKKEFASTVDRGCPLVMGGPLPHVIAAKAVAFEEALQPSFAEYSLRIVENAQALAEHLQKKGAHVLTGGTDNHMVLVDVAKSFALHGKAAEDALLSVHITINRNAVPKDPKGPWITSGIRIGTPALTTLGMGPSEMVTIGNSIVKTLSHTKMEREDGKKIPTKVLTDPKVMEACKKESLHLLQQFPVYPELPIF